MPDSVEDGGPLLGRLYKSMQRYLRSDKPYIEGFAKGYRSAVTKAVYDLYNRGRKDGLTQARIADILGLKQTTVSRLVAREKRFRNTP